MGKPTMEELDTLINRQKELRHKEEEERERVTKALKLGLCPTCGELLIRENEFKRELERPQRRLFGLRSNKTHDTWDAATYCSENKEHYLRRHYNTHTYDYPM